MQLTPVVATAAPAVSYDDDVDDATTIDACFATAFVLGERMARTLEAIARRLPAPVQEEGEGGGEDDDDGEDEEHIIFNKQ